MFIILRKNESDPKYINIKNKNYYKSFTFK